MDKTRREGIFFTLLAVVGYSFTPVFTKNLLAGGMPPVDLAIWRFAFAVPLVWALIAIRRAPPPRRPLPRPQLLLLGVLLTAAALAAFFGLERVPASTYIVLFYTYPAMIAVISLFLGERLPLQGWLALGMTAAGVALTAPDFITGLRGGDAPGFALAILNALVIAVYFLLNMRILRGHQALTRASAWATTGAFIPLGLIAPLNGVTAPPNLAAWGHLLGLTTVSTVLPIFALTLGINKLGAARASIVSTVEPPLTILLAVLLLGETMRPVQMLGSVLILTSVVLLNVPTSALRSRRRKAGASLISG